MNRLICIAALLLPLTGCADAREAPIVSAGAAGRLPPSVQAEIRNVMREHTIPGLAVATISGGSVDAIAAFGQRDREAALDLTPDTVMAGMSWTKFVFAAYVAELAAERRIDLDRPIGDYLPKPLPSFPHYRDLAEDDRWKQLTLRLLLSHRSGLPNFRFFPPNSDLDRTAPLAFFRQPGTAYGYSGEGIQIAQLVVAQALGIDIATDLERRLFAPAGLRRTGPVWKDAFNDNFDIAYGEANRRLGHDKRDRFDAAGSMNTSIADFATFTAAFLRGAAISPDARRMLLTRQTPIRSAHQFPPWSSAQKPSLRAIDLAAGLGVVLWRGRQGEGFFKGGHDDGGDNMLVCLIQRQRCVLVMMNAPKGHLAFPRIVEAILGPTDLPWTWEYSQLDSQASQ